MSNMDPNYSQGRNKRQWPSFRAFFFSSLIVGFITEANLQLSNIDHTSLPWLSLIGAVGLLISASGVLAMLSEGFFRTGSRQPPQTNP